jgi:hypothetical protein
MTILQECPERHSGVVDSDLGLGGSVVTGKYWAGFE